tara:strand:- start:16196 stop:16960 length:765 start_codon:yes stop_codon:yes gene_type:complete
MDRKIALLIEYDGTKYYGFQYQPNYPTIQGEIENALNNLNLSTERIEGAGRTDTGVHAKGQIASFVTNTNLNIKDIESGINHFLPSDIAVQKAYETPITFSPRRDAISRRYRYTFLNRPTRSPLSERYAYRVSKHINVDKMTKALFALKGTHDFVNLCGKYNGSTVRNIMDVSINIDDERLYIDLEANAFLPHQVRRTAGLLYQVGLNKFDSEEVEKLIDIDNQITRPNIPTLPACGLVLLKVKYKDMFEYDYY